ncbi:MAG TPA: CCA tRNA nucleotidyltransferase, partial [Mycobacteriales bacterium]|nr:CCA tRNA nucleotidyltransferase [Mycobacteriales bacterium]
MITVPPLADEIGARFAAAGHELWLVGGSVRDLLLDRGGRSPDLDFATDATPEQMREIARGWAEAVFDLGAAFGTIGLQRDGQRLEITTFRSESYDADSRNPTVQWGDSLEGDLARRDFTVNALAVSVPDHVFVDVSGGMRDLAAGVLDTPASPEQSFTDDPLRILRAARFTVQLAQPERPFLPAPRVVTAMRALADRLTIVSPERVRDELSRLMLADDPVPGLELLVETGVADVVLPELPRLRAEADPLHRHKDVYTHSLAVLRNTIDNEVRLPDGGPDLSVRLAALLHDIAKPDTRRFTPGGGVTFHYHDTKGAHMARKRLKALRFDNQLVSDVCDLIEMHLRFHGYRDAGWTDSAVRRYVTDAGPLLDRLHVLVRSDCTTRNERRAKALSRAYDDLEERIAFLREKEELALARKPDIDGDEVQRLL